MNDGLSYDDMGDLVSRKYLKYIAAQGPKHDTCSDFWKMILQNGVQFIVMLTQLQDRGREKCYRYWPEKIDESVDFSVDTSYDRRIHVTLLEEIVTTSSINPNIVIYIERRLKVRLIREVVSKSSKVMQVEQQATITQLHYSQSSMQCKKTKKGKIYIICDFQKSILCRNMVLMGHYRLTNRNFQNFPPGLRARQGFICFIPKLLSDSVFITHGLTTACPTT